MIKKEELAVIHALWIGKSLGKLSVACLTSFVMRGHKVYLHAYDKVIDIPEGVILLDANKVIPGKNIIKHKKTGSYALFSDVFRYKLLRETGSNNVYVDCDVYCLKPISVPKSGCLFGWEDDKHINGAVLALPADSELLKSLLDAAYDDMFIPPWFSLRKQKKLRLKKFFGLGRKIENMPWGVIGPIAITYYVNSLNLQGEASSIDVLYPVHYTKVIGYLTDPDLSVNDIITHRTKCIHLYNEMLKGLDLNNIDKNSILGKILENTI